MPTPYITVLCSTHPIFSFFFFNDTATTEIYTLSLHDALPIYPGAEGKTISMAIALAPETYSPLAAVYEEAGRSLDLDRKSTRLNSSHSQISYAVFCLKKKNIMTLQANTT